MQAWVSEAARLPIAFAQVREDPRLDLEVCPPNADVVMIASGGETAVCLSRLPLSSLTLVDMNPAQLALTRCKLELARGERNYALAWLGHAEGPRAVEELLGRLDLPADALGPVAARGADHSGRYERVFAALRESDFETAMALPNLVAVFGEQATQNPRQSFAAHFAERVALARSRPDAERNPFLYSMMHGAFPPGVLWDWLLPENWTPPRVEPSFVRSRMLEALAAHPAASVDFLHLSNILDWLSPAEASALLAASHRVLRPGGRVLIRQLNSSLDIPALASELHWEENDLEPRDRSFFYPQIHLGRR